MTDRRPFILSLNASLYGHHEASWRRAGADPESFAVADFYLETARLAEQARFDIFFLADFLAYDPDGRYQLVWPMEPTAVMSAVARATEHIGLVATGSTTYNPAPDIAHLFATLDHVTNGRTGWNIVTSGRPFAAQQFDRENQVPHAERYRHAHSYVGEVTDIWERAGRGRAEGFLAPVQGRPLYVQAGSSEDGKEFAARYGEVLFTAQTTQEQAGAFRKDVRRRARAYGRAPDAVRTIPGFAPVLGSTEEEARRLKDELDDLILPEKMRGYVEGWGFDLSGYDLDDPFPVEMTLDPAFDGITSRFEIVRRVAERGEPMTIRQFARHIAGSRGHATHVGTPEQVIAILEDWFHADVNDGFMIMPSHYPEGFADFVEQVIPTLQDKGIVQRDYGEGTLRERLGFEAPFGEEVSAAG